MGSVSVDKLWPVSARAQAWTHMHTQTRAFRLFLAIVLTKWFTRVQFAARCLRDWECIGLRPSLFLESAAYFRLTRGICCRVCRFGDSVIIPQKPPKFGKLKGKCSPVCWSLLRLSLEPLEMSLKWAVSEHRQILGKSKPVCASTDRAAAFIFISKLSCMDTWCDACKEQQMPKHTRDIRCALKPGPACLISAEPTWKNRCLKKKNHHYYPLLLFHLVERSVCHWCSLNLTFLYCLP